MEKIGDFFDGLTDKLVDFTGWDETLCLVIIMVITIWLIATVFRWLFGSSEKKKESVPPRQRPNYSQPTYVDNGEERRRIQREQEEERRRIRMEQEEAQRRRRANELHQNEIMEGRRQNGEW